MAEKFSLSVNGTAKELEQRLQRYVTRKKGEYKQHGAATDRIWFWDEHPQPEFSSVTIVDSSFIFVSRESSKGIVSVSLEYDGVGISGKITQVITKYSQAWKTIQSLCVAGSDLFISHRNGISAFGLQTGLLLDVWLSVSPKCSLASFGEGVLFSSERDARVYKTNVQRKVSVFAGTGVEGSLDGPVNTCQFRQPVGICLEFDTVVFV